jgi:hypothetical protein
MAIKFHTNFDTEKILKRYSATRFCGEMQIKDRNGNWSDNPVAMFFVSNPDTNKGHKNYLYLFLSNDQVYVGGLSSEQMEALRYQTGVKCDQCDDVIYSRYRHDYVTCTCGEQFIDGGRDYTRTNINAKLVTIDFVTGDYDEDKIT